MTDAYGSTVQTDTVTMTIAAGPAAPVLTGASAGPNGITVTWNAVEGATKYRVYRKTGSGGWTSQGDVTGLSYTDAAVTSGTTYTYTVKAYNGSTWSGFDAAGVSATAK
ncbi:MAG: fibronectin type III domain-containing protein [Oscillospiraceae bacterium]|nr:fibronectin type III domain-containing protein [Oscillospiraceae bacterium]